MLILSLISIVSSTKLTSKLYNINNVIPNQLLYTGEFFIGSPSQKFNLVIDTGSSVPSNQWLWVEEKGCPSCSAPDEFDPQNSSTFIQTNKTQSTQVTFKQYIDGTYLEGPLSTDMVAYSNSSLSASLTFILAKEVTWGYNPRSLDGYIGLGFSEAIPGYTTFIDALKSKGIISQRIFSIYFNRVEKAGYGSYPSSLMIGGYDLKKYTGSSKPDMIITQIDDSGWWNTFATSVNVFGIDYFFNYSIGFDSGKSFVFVSSDIYAQLNTILLTKNFQCATVNQSIYCNCTSARKMPTISINFNGKTLKVKAENIWDYSQKQCQLLLKQSPDIDTWFLGTSALQNLYLIFDMDNRTVSMTQASFPSSSSSSNSKIMSLAWVIVLLLSS